jgi:hypothetical protein
MLVRHETREVVLVCRGASTTSNPDYLESIDNIFSTTPAGPLLSFVTGLPVLQRITTTLKQAKDGFDIATELGFTMTVTGHSLGGYVANVLGARLDIHSFNINGPVPVWDADERKIPVSIDQRKMHLVRADNDGVSAMAPVFQNTVEYKTGTGHSLEDLWRALTDRMLTLS